ncbi:hypothetical protein BCR42DRAFT_450165 [Absidia repens]|uniref:LIM zinc-binding domain-containing protein n=1 Tax=Absidia repens TaxID=90262 RepID=A0A1X2IMN1_9FUNG|nr:hypothetical protein BCR42DRAFT_450165 [Absidia repens]
MPPRFGGAPSCVRCQKAVYMAEQVIGPSGAYHKVCLTCKECNKRLDSTTLTEREGEAYCKVCHSRKWGIKGYGFAGGASFLSTEDKMPKDILESQQQQELSSPPSTPPRMALNNNTAPTLPTRPTASEIQQTPSSSINNNVNDDVPSPSFWSNRSVPSVSSTASAPAPAPAPVPVPARTNVNDQPQVQQPSLPPRPSAAAAAPAAAPAPVNNFTGPKSSYLTYQTGYVPKKLNFGIQNDVCTKCGKAVYAAELALGAGNKYHKLCLKCCQCGKLLSSTNMQDRDRDLYCRGCYSKSFGPKGYGYGNLLTPEGATR